MFSTYLDFFQLLVIDLISLMMRNLRSKSFLLCWRISDERLLYVFYLVVVQLVLS